MFEQNLLGNEELWARFGNSASLSLEAWPKFDPELCKTSSMTIVVQVNGKKRGQFDADVEAAKEAILEEAKGLEKVAAQLEGKQIIKEIYVPKKLVNLVVR